MRDIVLTLVIFGTLPFILWRPHIGVLVWTWIGFMNPHRLTWGFAYDMQFALIVALVTLVSVLISREPKKVPWTGATIILLFSIVWMLITTIFSIYPVLAWPHMEKVAKIQLMIFVTLMLMQSKERIDQLVWVMALSIAFYGVKGGIFTILNGGVYHVRGPENSFIGGDNEMGLALIMTIPLLRYMQLSTSKVWLRAGVTAAMVLTAIAAVGSQSRGAMLGIAAMGVFLWLKSRNKIFTGLIGVVATVLILAIMPQQWFDRMATIQNYDTDTSALGRIIYAPSPEDVHDSHSIYFEVLGEHGFVGLALFLLLGLATWRAASWVIKRARSDPARRWAADLAAMVQVSLVGYASSGAFLGLAYFDYYYTLIAVIVLCKTVVGATKEAHGAQSEATRMPQAMRRPSAATPGAG